MKYIFLVIILLFLIAGCSNNPQNPGGPKGTFRTTVVNVDGRQIPCITWKFADAGGLSCDWSQR